jgi:hypothetical protein
MSGTSETIYFSVMPAEAGIQYHMTLRTLIIWTPAPANTMLGQAPAGVTALLMVFHQQTLTA